MSRKNFFATGLALILSMSVLLSGCGTSKGTDKETSTQKTEISQTAQEQTKPEPSKFSIFVDHTWFWADSFGNRPIDDEITKRTGISLDVTKASDDNQLPVMIASGDMTDLIYTGRVTIIDQLSNEKVCYDWNDLIQKFAPTFTIPAIEISNNTAPDGKFYAIKNAYSPPEDYKDARVLPSQGTNSLTIREDIMTKLGNPSLKSLDDLEKILISVKKQFPEMNPLILGPDRSGIDFFYRNFGKKSDSKGVYAENDKVYYHINDQAYFDAVQYLNRLYRQNLIAPETMVYKYEQFQQDVNSGKVFAISRSAVEESNANSAYQAAGSGFKAAVLQNQILSDKAQYVSDSIGWSGTYITKSCKNPDRAIQFMQFMKSDEGQKLSVWGLEGVHYTLTPEGYCQYTDKMNELKKDYNGMVRSEGIGCWTFGMSAKTEGIWNYNPNQPGITAALESWKSIMKFNPEYYFLTPPGGTDENGIYTRLAEYVKTEEPKLIAAKSEEDFKASFDKFIKGAEKIGMRTLEEWMTKEYPNVMKKYNK